MAEKDNIRIRFGQRVAEVRKEKGFSQEQLARVGNIDRSYVSRIERGKNNISIEIAERISKALEIRLKVLFDF